MTLTPALRRKLARNARFADFLHEVDPAAASLLRACHKDKRARYWCKSKLCVFCWLDRTDRYLKVHQARILLIEKPYHLTLSTWPVPVLDLEDLQGVKNRFKWLREGLRFSRYVRGGIVSVHCKWSDQDAGWLVHVHVLLDCTEKPPVGFLKREWHRRGGGQQVELKEVRDGRVRRVLAYGTLGHKLPEDAERVRQFYKASYKFRFTEMWGTMSPNHGRKLRRAATMPAAVSAS